MSRTNFFIKYKLPLLLWFLCTAYLILRFIIGLSAGLLREEIMVKFNIGIESFSAFAACYYIGYAGMQVPIGILIDKFNFKLVVILFILTTATGTFICSISPSWNLVLFARFLVGTGTAAAFLSAAKAIKLYFPAQYQAKMLGITFAIGLLGGVFGGGPMQSVFEYIGSDQTFKVITITAIIIASIIFFIGDKKMEKLDDNTHDNVTMKNILRIVFSPIVLSIGIFGGFMVGTFEGFADVWAIPYFEQIYGYSKGQSSFLSISCFYFGMGIGGPILAWISDTINKPFAVIIFSGAVSCLILGLLTCFNNIDFVVLSFFMVFLGIAGAYQILTFTIANNLVDKSFTGLMTGMINGLIMLFGPIIHTLIAKTVGFFWDGSLNLSGSPIYTKETLIYGISIVPIFCIVGMVGFLFLSKYMKNKHIAIKLDLVNK